MENKPEDKELEHGDNPAPLSGDVLLDASEAADFFAWMAEARQFYLDQVLTEEQRQWVRAKCDVVADACLQKLKKAQDAKKFVG